MKIRDQRDDLENLLNNSSINQDKNVPSDKDIPTELKSEPTTDVDFTALRFQCDEEAKELIKKSISFIISDEMIENNPYLSEKVKVDAFSLAGMLYQLRCNEIIQRVNMEQIKSGMVHPRMFEVFSQMSKVLGELHKQLIQTVEAIKETYKMAKGDIKEMSMEALGQHENSQGMLTSGDGSIVTRGTKELIKSVQKIKTQKDILEIEDVSEVKDKE